MWRRLFGGPRRRTGVEPEWWRVEAYPSLSVERLTEVCDAYWDDRPLSDGRVPSHGHMRSAVAELAIRGTEVQRWAVSHLSHPDYDAREQAASILAGLADRHLLTGRDSEITARLSELALRPWGDDTKEVQANCAAVWTLGKIGDKVALSTFRRLLLDDGWWSDDEIRWNTAEALAAATGEPFMSADDPIAAAVEWLKTHPER